MAGSVVLGRRLLQQAPAPVAPPAAATTKQQQAQAPAQDDEILLSIQLHDRFFCDTMELIPSQFYFPTDEEDNWKKSAPKANKKYHRDILAQKQQVSSKKVSKRAKFNPTEQKTNEQKQHETALDEQQQKQQQKQVAPPATTAKDPSSVSIDGLKERLAAKLALMREQRNKDEKQHGKKRKNNASSKDDQPANKKRKGAAVAPAFNNTKAASKAGAVSQENGKDKNHTESSSDLATEKANGDLANGSAISYGSLLLAEDDGKKHVKKTRNGQSVRGIQNLLKKAERNQQRMEELKQTEEGKALVESKNWNKALKQAAGEVVLDDPKLLRKRLKKKEKAKTKSTKEWKKRTALVEIAKKDRVKKRMENLATGGKKDPKEDKSKKPPRAGFEGKKGETFLNKGGKGKHTGDASKHKKPDFKDKKKK